MSTAGTMVAGAVGVQVVRARQKQNDFVEYEAWRLNVGRLLRTLHAIGGTCDDSEYVLDLLDDDQNIVGDVCLSRAGVAYMRTKKLMRRAPTEGAESRKEGEG